MKKQIFNYLDESSFNEFSRTTFFSKDLENFHDCLEEYCNTNKCDFFYIDLSKIDRSYFFVYKINQKEKLFSPTLNEIFYPDKNRFLVFLNYDCIDEKFKNFIDTLLKDKIIISEKVSDNINFLVEVESDFCFRDRNIARRCSFIDKSSLRELYNDFEDDIS